MEIALNLFWVMIVVAAYALWLRRPLYRGLPARRRQERAAALLVLACVLVLVFPIISATDDVRSAREFLEEPTSDQPLLKSLELQKRAPLGVSPAPVAALAQSALAFGALRPLGLVSVVDPSAHDFQPLRPAPGRAPPQA